MSKRRNPATCCQGTVWSCCRDDRVALMRLIRFRFGKAMGLSGAGPSTTTQSQPALHQSLLLLLLLLLPPLRSSSGLLGTTGALLRISGALVFFSRSTSGYSHSAAASLLLCPSSSPSPSPSPSPGPGGPVWRCLLMQLYWRSKIPAPPSTCRVCCPFRQAISAVRPVYWST